MLSKIIPSNLIISWTRFQPGRAMNPRRYASKWIAKYYQEGDFNLRKEEILQEILPSLLPSEDLSLSLLKDLSRTRGALSTTFTLRNDILSLLTPSSPPNTSSPVVSDEKVKGQLKSLDKVLQQWLSYSLSLDTLELRRITFDTSSGSILEKVARGESVHRVRSLAELKRRLHDGKRCFGLFHPTLPDEPLVFIHVGLTTELSKSLAAIDQCKTDESPTHAIFYSVNSPLSALRGLDVASLLIKEVANHLQSTFPTIKTFSTLSPIPKFTSWLQKEAKNPSSSIVLPSKHVEQIQKALTLHQQTNPTFSINKDSPLISLCQLLSESSFQWTRNKEIVDALKEPMLWIGAKYITAQKVLVNKQSLPLDDVARFHLRNGAIFHSINWMANPSENGLKSSSSMMINYLYDLPQVESNAINFQQRPDQLPHSSYIRDILSEK